MQERLREILTHDLTKRIGRIGYWIVMAGLLFYLYRKVMPSIDLADLGPAPPLEMSTLDGDTVSLADHRGRVVVVNVWATWCPPCRVETPGFIGLQEEFEGEVQFLGLSQDDDLAAVRDFAADYGVNYPLLVGANRAGGGYRPPVLPTTYLIDKRGRIRFQHSGLLLTRTLRSALAALAAE